MAAPQPKSSIADYVDYNLYVIARLEADPKVEPHAPLLQQPHDLLMKDVGARNLAGNLVLKASAKRDYARDTVLDTLEPMSLSIAAHYKSKAHPGYGRVFARTPAQYAVLARRELLGELTKVKAALQEPETPKEVLKHAAEFLAALAAFAVTEEAQAKVLASYKKAVDLVDKAKLACLDASSKLRARLQDQFPRQPKIVARYFPPVQARTSDKVSTGAAVAGQNLAPA